jgi:hypothetical protein
MRPTSKPINNLKQKKWINKDQNEFIIASRSHWIGSLSIMLCMQSIDFNMPSIFSKVNASTMVTSICVGQRLV